MSGVVQYAGSWGGVWGRAPKLSCSPVGEFGSFAFRNYLNTTLKSVDFGAF